jgi:hypothetical protein
MATSFHNAVLGAHNALRSSRGLDVTYCRGDATVAVTAVPGQTRVTVEDASGLSIRAKRRDWIVRASDLLLGGQTVLPEVGDTIRLTVGQDVQVFEVQRLAGEGHYTACDDLGQVLRIHTRQIDTEQA